MNPPILEAPQEKKQPTIKDLFDQFSPFEVPAYQRAYSWEKEHTTQFIEDLREHPTDKPYYLGHFLLEEVESGPVYVIDGQQRLTTLVLFFGSLRRLLLIQGFSDLQSAAHPDSLNMSYLVRNHEMCFKTTKDDQGMFLDLVFEGRTSAVKRSRSQERLREASYYFDRIVGKEDTDTLVRWAKTLGDAQITFFPVHGKVQATQIFTFQNSRGKKLTEFEKFKAYLMHQIYLHAPTGMEKTAITSLEQEFASIYREMENIHLLDENGVLRHHDHAYSIHPQWNSPLKNLKTDLGALTEPLSKVIEITRYCKKLSSTFQQVREIERIMKREELVADILILDAGNSWPLLIKLYEIFGEDFFSDRDVRFLLKNVELVLFRMDFQSGHVANELIHRTKELSETTALARISNLMAKSVHTGFKYNRWNFDDNVNSYFEEDYHYDRISRYVLWKYENSLTDRTDRKVTPDDYLNLWGNSKMESTIEHVSSRTPQGIPNTDDFNRRFLNNIGNLVLMPRAMNSSQGNKPNEEKQPLLDRSTYGAHREIATMMGEEGTWTDEKITKRKANIVTFIRKQWRLPEPPPKEEATSLPTESALPLESAEYFNSTEETVGS